MVDKITTPVTPLEEVAKINEIIDNLGGGSSSGWSLLEHKWTEALLDDESWLLANNFSWHNKSAYEDAYNQLVDDIDGITPTTETVGSYTVTYYPTTSGRKIVLADQETAVSNIYTESGVAWYYILDTTNERFKLPRENPAREELIQVIRAKGNDTNVGFTDGTENYGIRARGVSASNGFLYVNKLAYDGGVGSSDTNVQNANAPDNGLFLGITKDSTKSGIISSMTDSASVYKGKKYLYFYVGQYSQSATEQTAGLNAELFNGKADRDLNNVSSNIDYVVESYKNGSDWYRIYKSGWCEQGGVETSTSTTFLVPFVDTNYFVAALAVTTASTSQTNRATNVTGKTTTGFTTYAVQDRNWFACGYIR